MKAAPLLSSRATSKTRLCSKDDVPEADMTDSGGGREQRSRGVCIYYISLLLHIPGQVLFFIISHDSPCLLTHSPGLAD